MGLHFWLVSTPLPALATRDPLPDRPGQPCLHHVPGPPPPSLVGVDADTPSVAEAALSFVRGVPGRFSGVSSLIPAAWRPCVAPEAVPPCSSCPLVKQFCELHLCDLE